MAGSARPGIAKEVLYDELRSGAGGALLLSGWRLRPRWHVLTMAVGVLLVGCGSPSPRPTPTASRSAHATQDAAAQAVLAAYRAGWTAFITAAKQRDPSLPALSATLVDPLLQAVHGDLIQEQYQGSVLDGDIELTPRLVEMTDTTATVLDCTYDSTAYVYVSNRSPVPPVTAPHHAGIRATLVKVGGTWKVSDQAKDAQACSAT